MSLRSPGALPASKDVALFGTLPHRGLCSSQPRLLQRRRRKRRRRGPRRGWRPSRRAVPSRRGWASCWPRSRSRRTARACHRADSAQPSRLLTRLFSYRLDGHQAGRHLPRAVRGGRGVVGGGGARLRQRGVQERARGALQATRQQEHPRRAERLVSTFVLNLRHSHS